MAGGLISSIKGLSILYASQVYFRGLQYIGVGSKLGEGNDKAGLNERYRPVEMRGRG